MSSYKKLIKFTKEIGLLDSIGSILSWDTETIMPAGAQSIRALQKAQLSKVLHKKRSSNKMRSLIEAVDPSKLNEDELRNYSLVKRQYDVASKIPTKLVVELSAARSQSLAKWKEAKLAKDHKIVINELNTTFQLVKQQAEIAGDMLGLEPYDAMLDIYDEGRTQVSLNEAFGKLKTFLPSFIDNVISTQRPLFEDNNKCSKETQKLMFQKLMEIMGFDFDRGRFDESAHPFCGGTINDVRLTTSYDESNLIGGLFATIHETGHALYEQGLPSDSHFTPAGSNAGMSIHESQSLYMECQIGGNKTFLHNLYELITNYFPQYSLTSEQFIANSRHVKKSFIRIMADEVTYPLHVIMRYEIERDLFSGKIEIRDLQEIWNEKFKELFGLLPANDSEGFIQDIHWFWGMFGYFPCYSIGAMTAAQIAHIIEAKGVRYESFASFAAIKNELANIIYKNANKLGFGIYKQLDSLAGRSSVDCFIDYLKNKYS